MADVFAAGFGEFRYGVRGGMNRMKRGLLSFVGVLTISSLAACTTRPDVNESKPIVCPMSGNLGGDNPLSGTISGTDVDGSICDGTASIHAEGNLTSAFQFALFINSSVTDPKDPPFRLPADVTNVSITVLAGLIGVGEQSVSSAGNDCGTVTFCLREPVPSSVVCSGSENCAPGCDLEGPISAPTCTPVAPEVCYTAQAAPDCMTDSFTKPVIGDWTLQIDSTAFLDGGDAGSVSRYTAHGSLAATMVEDGASATTAALTLRF